MGKFKVGTSLLISFFTLTNLIFSVGCNPSRDQLSQFNSRFYTGDYENSAILAQKKISKKKKPTNNDLLWTLQLASVERMRQNHQQSNLHFDNSEDMLKFFDERSNLKDTISTTIVNDNAMPYKGEEYDGIMVNTYKALNFMAAGDMDLARVEFNRALDRQRRAKENYNAEIQKLNEKITKNKNQNNINQTLNDPRVNQKLLNKYPNLYNFQVYPDFVNPFTTYLAGIFFNISGDYQRSADLFKESYGMISSNSYIAEDLSAMEGILDSNSTSHRTVWLIFENGLGPVKTEYRVDLPLFVATNQVRYAGIALPKLTYRNSAYRHLLVEADDNTYKTQVVADMDRVIQTEFSKDYKGILTRAIIVATAKVAAQYAIQNQNSEGAAYAAIAMALYSYSTTAADVRIWTALPKNFQVARFNKPNNGKITVLPPGSSSFEIIIPDCKNAIIYIRIIATHTQPVYDVITIK